MLSNWDFSPLPVSQSFFFSTHLLILILFCFRCMSNLCRFFLLSILSLENLQIFSSWRFIVTVDQLCFPLSTEASEAFLLTTVFMDGFSVNLILVFSLLSCLCFPSFPPCLFAPGQRGGPWCLAHLMDCREEMQASQNKLHHQLLAGGKKLCTHNLLMVCKLRAEFAPSSILHLSLPFFPLIPSSPSAPFPLFSSVFERSCTESRLLNPWIYEAERISSAHVNYPNICIWVSLQKGPHHFYNPIPISSSG